MKLKIIVHPAEEGGFWAEGPAIQGCATQGETMEELLVNLHDAVDACLSVDLETIEISEHEVNLLFIKSYKSPASFVAIALPTAIPIGTSGKKKPTLTL